MDDDLTISLPDALRQRATTFAARRGETVENVVCEALEQYVTALAPLAPVAHNRPRTLLGSRLRALRSQVLAADEPLLAERTLPCEHLPIEGHVPALVRRRQACHGEPFAVRPEDWHVAEDHLQAGVLLQ